MSTIETIAAVMLSSFLFGAVVFIGIMLLETIIEVWKQPYYHMNWRQFEKREKKKVIRKRRFK